MNWRLLLPWCWLSIFSGSKNFRDNPVIGNTQLNKWGLHVWRKNLAHRFCQKRRERLGKGLPQEWRDQYMQSGFVHIDQFLAPDRLQALRSEMLSHALPMIEMHQPPALTRRALLDETSCAHLPAALALLRDPRLFKLMNFVAGYPGSPIITLQCISSDADQAGQSDPQTQWHTDTFHSTAKAWLFLHEVSLDEGPLAYIPGSHRFDASRKSWEQSRSESAAADANAMHAKGSWRASAEELSQMGIPVESAWQAAVAANTLVVADTGGFHRRTPSPESTVRLEIYLSLRRNPYFASLVPSVLSWPGVKQHWAHGFTQFNSFLHRQGFRVWTPAYLPGLTAREKQRLETSE